MHYIILLQDNRSTRHVLIKAHERENFQMPSCITGARYRPWIAIIWRRLMMYSTKSREKNIISQKKVTWKSDILGHNGKAGRANKSERSDAMHWHWCVSEIAPCKRFIRIIVMNDFLRGGRQTISLFLFSFFSFYAQCRREPLWIILSVA